MADVSLIIGQLNSILNNISSPSASEAERLEILNLCQKVAVSLETPFETMQRIAYCPIPLIMARVCQSTGIFKTLISTERALCAAEIASTTGVNILVLEMILDYLRAQQMAEEISPGYFRSTKLTHILMDQLFVDGVTHFHDNVLPAFTGLEQKIINPQDPRTAFEIGQRSDVGFYDWMETHPIQAKAFDGFMQAQFASLPSWLSVVDFDSEISNDADPSTFIFVDVGGGTGQQCQALCNKFPNIEGRIVNQDRPEVLDKAITGSRVDRMSYDYLTEQPVKAARAYYFRQILHNNDDATCLRILKSQIPAMSEDSVILIDEKVLPDHKADTTGGEYTAALSLAMLSMFNAMERREAHWRRLLSDAGLQVRDIRRFTDFGDSLIIATKNKGSERAHI